MYIQEKLSKFDVELTLKEKNITTIDVLSNEIKLSKDHIIDLICEEEMTYLYSIYGKVTVLTLEEVLDELKTVSESTLRRRKARGYGEGPRHVQSGKNAKIYYPVREIASEMYLESHPIMYNEVSLSKIIKTRHA